MSWGFVGKLRRALELPAGDSQDELSPIGRIRLRFNRALQRLEQSISGAAYGPVDKVHAAVSVDATGSTFAETPGWLSITKPSTGVYVCVLEASKAIALDANVATVCCINGSPLVVGGLGVPDVAQADPVTFYVTTYGSDAATKRDRDFSLVIVATK